MITICNTMAIPIFDVGQTLTFFTGILLLLNIAIYFVSTKTSFADFAFISNEFWSNPIEHFFKIITSMFFHANVIHLIYNMSSLFVFGDNVEIQFGPFGFLALYFISGILAVLAYALVFPTSKSLLIGASGAVAGILGAYFWLFPKSNISFLSSSFDVTATGSQNFFTNFIISQVVGLSLLSKTGISFISHITGFFVGILFAMVYQK